jgi:uncharacterized membrane protein/protein-disulfide isomerase
MNRQGSNRTMLAAMWFLAVCGLALNVCLLFMTLSDPSAGVIGCGGAEDCGSLFASRWARVLGVPVTAFGAIVYLGVIASLLDGRRRGLAPLLGLIVGAAAWLTFAQGFLEKKFCPWCMAAHGIGIALAVLGFLLLRKSVSAAEIGRPMFNTGYLGCAAVALIQLWGPVPGAEVADIKAPPQHEASKGFPRLGSPHAKHELVEFFDYQCGACGVMSGFLTSLMRQYPNDIAVVLRPVPLDGSCNPHASQHPGSCEMTRIALAVWRVEPMAFPRFHSALLAQPEIPLARKLALEILGADGLEKALADPRVDESIRSNIAAWHKLSAATPKLPKLVVKGTRILHGLPSGEEDFIRVIAHELKPGTPSSEKQSIRVEAPDSSR